MRGLGKEAGSQDFFPLPLVCIERVRRILYIRLLAMNTWFNMRRQHGLYLPPGSSPPPRLWCETSTQALSLVLDVLFAHSLTRSWWVPQVIADCNIIWFFDVPGSIGDSLRQTRRLRRDGRVGGCIVFKGSALNVGRDGRVFRECGDEEGEQ